MSQDNKLTGSSKAQIVWENIFDTKEYVFGRSPNAFLVSCLPYLKNKKNILMVADGEGRNSVWAAKQGFIVDAFDLSKNAIDKAQKLAQEQGVKVNYTVSGIDDFAWPKDTYDAVAIIFCQFATPSMRQRMFQNAVDALKKDGILMIIGYTPKQLQYNTGGPKKQEHLYTKEMIQTYFASLETLLLQEKETEISEGSRHTGMSAILEFVARK